MTARSLPEAVFVDIEDPADNELAISAVRKLARELGFSQSEEFLVATAVSELATNILRYAGRGQMTLRALDGPNGPGLEVVAVDAGPGIADLQKAMQDHYSTGGSLGLGLPSVARIMDEFTVRNRPGGGALATARKWLERPCS